MKNRYYVSPEQMAKMLNKFVVTPELSSADKAQRVTWQVPKLLSPTRGLAVNDADPGKWIAHEYDEYRRHKMAFEDLEISIWEKL